MLCKIPRCWHLLTLLQAAWRVPVQRVAVHEPIKIERHVNDTSTQETRLKNIEIHIHYHYIHYKTAANPFSNDFRFSIHSSGREIFKLLKSINLFIKSFMVLKERLESLQDLNFTRDP